MALAADDIRDACDVLRPVHDEGGGKDGYVSLEVDPNLAHDTEGTIEEAKRLHALIDKPNLFIKIPATKEGLPAIEETIAAGIPVNVTLIFSLERHRAVAEAYVRGLQRHAERRRGSLPASPPSRRSSSRASTPRATSASTTSARPRRAQGQARDRQRQARLPAVQGGLLRGGSGRRWRDKGATAQRCLWASTSTKNPEYRDVIYVEELVGPDTVNTMPRATVDAVIDHGEIRDSLDEDLEGARKLLEDLKAAGIDYDDVVDTLEKEGVKKFADSFKELFADIESKRDQLVAA